MPNVIDVKTGLAYKDTSIFVESSAYKMSEVSYIGRSDTVNGVPRVHSFNSNVTVYIAAVPNIDPDNVCVMLKFTANLNN